MYIIYHYVYCISGSLVSDNLLRSHGDRCLHSVHSLSDSMGFPLFTGVSGSRSDRRFDWAFSSSRVRMFWGRRLATGGSIFANDILSRTPPTYYLRIRIQLA